MYRELWQAFRAICFILFAFFAGYSLFRRLHPT